MILRFGKLTIAIGEQSRLEVDRFVSCGRKVKYSGVEKAEKAALGVGRKKQESFQAYKCRHCDGWHIGHARD